MLHRQYDRIRKCFPIFVGVLVFLWVTALSVESSALALESSALPSETPSATESPEHTDEPEATGLPTEEPMMSPEPTATPKALHVTLKQSGNKMKLSWKKYSGINRSAPHRASPLSRYLGVMG